MNDRDFDDDFDDDVDAFDPYDDEPKGRFSQGLVLAGAGFLTLVGFAAVVWAAYGQGVRDGMKRGPAVVEAPAETYRSRPEAPGGLTVEGQDSEVLAQAAGDGDLAAASGYDRSAARDLDALIDDQTRGGEPADATEEPDPAAEAAVGADPVRDSLGDDSRAAPASDASTTTPVEPTDERPAEDAAPSRTPAVSAEAEATPIADPHFVQIASYRSAADAEIGWTRFLARNRPLVPQGIGPDVERADLGERGVYHRLRVGPFSGKAAADAFCEALKAEDQTCLVVAG